jgi:hypothetical protein
MDDFLVALEQTTLGQFIHTSSSLFGFPLVLTMHTFGLCFIVGANVIVSMRLLGLAPGIPLKPLRRLFPFMWLGLGLTAVSGFALAIAAATTRLLNPILIFKLVVIVVVAPLMLRMQKKAFDNTAVAANVVPQGAREMAASQLFLWLIVVIAGRLIAYSATILGEGY